MYDDSMPIPLMFILLFVCGTLWGGLQNGTLKGALECGVATVLFTGSLMAVVAIVCILYFILTGQF